MSKENKKQENEEKVIVGPMNVTEENIEAVIAGHKTMTKEVMDAAYKKIADDKKQELTNEYVKKLRILEYVKQMTIIAVRRSNKRNNVIREYNKSLTEILTKVSDSMSLKEFDTMVELKKKQNEKLIEIDREIEKLRTDVRKAYSDLSNDWRINDYLIYLE